MVPSLHDFVLRNACYRPLAIVSGRNLRNVRALELVLKTLIIPTAIALASPYLTLSG